ncbi:MAG TPA: hypothetical protein VHI10_06575 [Mycobacterium sp.]|nr:hypothetical protein [Mycobacterium sp.]
MGNLNRLRRVEKRIVKAQRRVWLLQAALWPTLVLAALGVIAVVTVRLRGRRGGLAQPVDGVPHL